MKIMKTIEEMNNQERMEYAKKAILFCKEKNLYLPSQMKKLKENPREMVITSIANMELYLKAHPEENKK